MNFSLLISSAALILCVIIFFYLRNFIKKQTDPEILLAKTREEINYLLIKFDKAIDQDITLLDDKEQTLKTLLTEIDKRLKVYSHELEKSLYSEMAYKNLGKSAKTKIIKTTEAPKDETNGLFMPEKPKPQPNTGNRPALSTIEKIRELSDSGFSSGIIASKLGKSIAEVELALALLNRKPG